MEQFFVTCPRCRFVLQFHDSTLLGRKGRCPKCHHKFVLEKPEKADGAGGDPPKRRAAQPAASKAAEQKLARSRPAPAAVAAGMKKPAVKPATRPPVRDKSGRSAGPADGPARVQEPVAVWEADGNRGLVSRRPTLSPRWVFPDVLAASTVLCITAGAVLGGAAAYFLAMWQSASILAAAATLGGAIGACALIRRHDPSRRSG